MPRGFRGLDRERVRSEGAAKEEKKERRRLFADGREKEREGETISGIGIGGACDHGEFAK